MNLDLRHALIGPDEAGKTIVSDLLANLLQPTRGQIMLLGADITKMKPNAVACMGAGAVPVTAARRNGA